MKAQLANRAVIALVGPEARSFLQGLVTNDVEQLAPARPAYAALLTPQGKILFDFLIFGDDDGLLLDAPRQVREALIKRLSLYKLRAKVTIAARDDLAVMVGSGNPDPRHRALPARMIGPVTDGPSGDDAYLATRLDLGIPEGADFGQDKMFALDAGLDELHAVSFDKGCYVGQELTARMKHRGTARKRLLLATTAGAPLPLDGSVTADDHEIGTITSVYGQRGFALIRLDRLTEFSGAALDVNGMRITVSKQDWLAP